MKFGQLILMEIIKIVATNCQVLRVKCTKFDPKTRWGAPSAPPDSLAEFNNDKVEEIFGSDLPLLVKVYEIWSVDSYENH